jgi:hypothetical protein
MDRSGVTLSGILITDPVAEVTDTGRVAVFTMTGGEVVLPADTGADTSDEGAIPDDALLAAYYESLDDARAKGNTYTVVVPDSAAQPALRHLRRGRSVIVHGRLDPATGRVTTDMLSSTLFLAYERQEGWIIESHASGEGSA